MRESRIKYRIHWRSKSRIGNAASHISMVQSSLLTPPTVVHRSGGHIFNGPDFIESVLYFSSSAVLT